MPRKWSGAYVDRLLEGNEGMDLSELSTVLCTSDRYDAEAADFGLPTFAFVFVELMTWTALSERSGCITYYESTPPARQAAMSAGLRAVAPPIYADAYDRGMAGWQDRAEEAAVDAWVAAKWPAMAVWARHLLLAHRDEVVAMA